MSDISGTLSRIESWMERNFPDGLSVLRPGIEEDLQSQKLVDLLPQWRAPKLTIHVASLPGRYRPRRLESFLEVLRAAILKIPGIER